MNESDNAQAAKHEREQPRKREDLGLVLSTLLGIQDDPTSLCSKFLAPDLKTYTGETRTLVGGGVLSGIQLQRGALVFVGGGGMVFQVQRSDVPGLHYALKVGRPSVIYDDEECSGECRGIREACGTFP